MAFAMRAGQNLIRAVPSAYKQTNKGRMLVSKNSLGLSGNHVAKTAQTQVVRTTSPKTPYARVSTFSPSFGSRVTGMKMGKPSGFQTNRGI